MAVTAEGADGVALVPRPPGRRPASGPWGSPGRRRRRGRRGEWWAAAAFLAPALALFLLLGVYTIAYGLALSFASWNGFTPSWTWVGLQNYRDLLWEHPVYAPTIRSAAANTALVAVALPVITIAVGLPLAVLLNTVGRLRVVLRSVFFLPYVTAGIAIYYAWRYIYEPDGALNGALEAVGLGALAQPAGWLGSTGTALPAVVAVLVWSAVPIAVLLYLTGLQAIDRSLVEAAQIDGASPWQVVRHLYWPLLRPITAAVVLLNIREALQGFQIFAIMTDGGPAGASNVLGLEAYNLAFFSGLRPTLGLASALGWLLFLLAVVLAAINVRALRSAS
jgi:ABC-type sugar transport system permease subunit